MASIEHASQIIYQKLLHFRGVCSLFLDFFEEQESLFELHDQTVDLVTVGTHASLAPATNMLKKSEKTSGFSNNKNRNNNGK